MFKKFNFPPSRQFCMACVLGVLISVSLACNSPATSNISENPPLDAVETAVKLTLDALPPENSPPQQPVNPPPTIQALPVNATVTLPPAPTVTPTLSKPMVSVSVGTNCRLGPGKSYKLVGYLLVGEETEVVARNPSENYWYVRNLDKPNKFCWLWGNYATLTGDYASLPVFTPPPTATPEFTATPSISFTVTFNEIESCVGWNLEFLITNNGGFIHESVSITVTDNDTTQSVVTTNNNFEEWNGCTVASSQSELLPGEAGYTVSGTLINNPTGHDIDATIRVCSGDGLGGTCSELNMNFTP